MLKQFFPFDIPLNQQNVVYKQLVTFQIIPRTPNCMKIQKLNLITYEYPSGSYLLPLKKRRYETLNQAINIIHKAPPVSEGKLADRYKLKSFDGKNIHLFQCWKQECDSHIIFKSHLNTKSDFKSGVQFQIHSINNHHNHQNPEILKTYQQTFKKFPILQKGSDSEENQIEKLDYIRHQLRRCNISNYFRDYINSFSSSKNQNLNYNLPYVLPKIFRSKPFLITLKIGYKCLNEKKKTYFFIIEVFLFGELYTEVKFVTSLKTKNPQIYLYTITLIYSFLNSIKNCAICMQDQLIRAIKSTKKDTLKLQSQKNEESQKFIKFFMSLQSQYLTDCTQNDKIEKLCHQDHIEKHYVQKSQRQYDRRKYFVQDIENSQKSFTSTDDEKEKFFLSPLTKKSYYKLQQMELRQVRSIKNKCLIAQNTYMQATMGKNGQWHICEEKPSVMQKINDLFHIQQIKRIQKEKNKEKTFSKDSNFINLSSDESDDQKMQQQISVDKKYYQKQQNQYLNHLLSDMFGDIQLREIQEKQNLSSSKKSESLVFIGDEEQKLSKIDKQIQANNQGFTSIDFEIEMIRPNKFKFDEIRLENKSIRLKFKKESTSSRSSESILESNLSQKSKELESESEDSND